MFLYCHYERTYTNVANKKRRYTMYKELTRRLSISITNADTFIGAHRSGANKTIYKKVDKNHVLCELDTLGIKRIGITAFNTMCRLDPTIRVQWPNNEKLNRLLYGWLRRYEIKTLESKNKSFDCGEEIVKGEFYMYIDLAKNLESAVNNLSGDVKSSIYKPEDKKAIVLAHKRLNSIRINRDVYNLITYNRPVISGKWGRFQDLNAQLINWNSQYDKHGFSKENAVGFTKPSLTRPFKCDANFDEELFTYFCNKYPADVVEFKVETKRKKVAQVAMNKLTKDEQIALGLIK